MKKTFLLFWGMFCISIISGACSKEDAFNDNNFLVDTLVIADTTININKDTIFINDTTFFENDTIIITDTIINNDTIITQDTLFVNTKDKLSEVPLADPYILYDGHFYYAYGTHTASSGFTTYKSANLYEWEYIGYVLHISNTNANGNFWAPEIHIINGIYHLFYATDNNIYVATSSSPEGPFVQIGEKPIIKGIDPHFYTENNKKYLFYVTTSGNNIIRMGELNEDLLSLKNGTIHTCLNPEGWEKKVVEGPFLIKHQNKYYLTYSGDNFKSKDYGIGVATSDSVTGKWVKASYNPVLQKPQTWVGTGHHSLFIDKYGKNRIVFHAHNNENDISPRRMYIGSYHIEENGIFVVEDDFIVPKLKH